MVVRDYTAGYAGLRIEPTLLPATLSPDDQAAFSDGVAGPGDWPRLSQPVQEAVEKHGTVALSGMEALAERILDDLWRAIEPELERPAESLDAHQRERAYHERFVADRTRLFLGRGAELQQVLAYVGDAQDRRMLVVTGEPGSGKSAFMAEAVRLCRELHPGALVIPHFIGAAPESAQLPATLRSLCETLRREEGIEEEVEADPLKLRNQLAAFLEKAGDRRTVVLFLDALNQLDPAGRSHELDWLPYLLPPGTKVVASTLAGDCLDQLRRRVPEDHVVTVPALPDGDRRALVEKFLAVRRKKLTSDQLDSVLDTSRRPDAGLPLYLLVALEELCLFGDYQALGERIDRLPERLPELFDQVLARLEHDHSHATTESVCAWLAVSRSGLLESEVLDLLGRDGTFPRIRWTRLYRALEPYLKPVEEATRTDQRGAGRLDFYHDQLRFAAHQRYLGMPAPDSEATDAYRAGHRQLAAYFHSIAQDETHPGEWRTDRPRGLSELPYHQTRGDMWEALDQTLCDLGFIAAKCAAGMTYDLVTDHDAALAALPEGREERERLRQLDERVARYTQEMIEYARNCSEARDRPKRWWAWLHRLPQRETMLLPGPPIVVRPWTDEEIRADSERIASASTRLDRVRAFGQFVSAESYALARFGRWPGFCVQQAYNSASTGPVARAAEVLVDAAASQAVLLLRPKDQRPAWTPRPTCLKTLEGHRDAVRAVAMTADGRRALSGSADKTLRLWDLDSGHCLRTFEGHRDSDCVTVLAVTPDGRRALFGSADNKLRLWDLDSDRCLMTLKGHGGAGRAVAMTADGRRALSGSADNKLCLWDLDSGRRLRTLEGHTGTVLAVAVTPDGRRALSGSFDTTLRLWDLDLGQCLRTLEGHTDSVYDVAGTPDARRALSGSDDNTLRAWDLDSGQCLKTLEGHTDLVSAVAVTPDGRRALSGSVDNTLRLWDLDSGQCLKNFAGHRYSAAAVAVTPDGRCALSGSDDKTLRLWDLDSGQCLRTFEGHTNGVRVLAVTPDGHHALSGSDDTLRLWDLDSGQCLRTFEGRTNLVAVTPDGRRVVSKSADKTLRLWDLDSGQCLRTLQGHTDLVSAVAMTADGRHAFSGSADKTLRLWDLDSGQCLRTFEGHTDYVTAVAVTPDGRRMVSNSKDDTLRFWDLDSGRCLKTVDHHRGWAAVTPDGRCALSRSYDNTLRLWDLDSGQCLRTFEGHTDYVSAVAVTPDGRRATSASRDRTLRLWDLDSGRCLALFPWDYFLAVAVSPRSLVFGAFGGAVGVLRPNQPLLTASPLVTATRLWRYGAAAGPGRWDDQLSVVCSWCGNAFPVDPPAVAGTGIPTSTAADIRCPARDCGQPLRLNPFVCDPLARASTDRPTGH